MYDNLDWAEGSANIPGMRPIVYYARKADIAILPELPAAPATADEAVTISDPITMVVGKTFKRMSLDELKSPVTCEPQGEDFNRSFLNKASFTVPLAGKKTAAFAMSANNDDLVYIGQDKEGNYRLLGNLMFRTRTKCTENIGDSPTSAKNFMVEVEVTDKAPAPYYTGPIETDDGTVNPGV